MDQLIPRSDNTAADPGIYDYASPEKTDGSLEADFVRAISATKTFKRLSDVRFLGALDYCLIEHPNGAQSNARFNRAQHSIGVASLAQEYLRLTKHHRNRRLVCVGAAMLHDIGHAPLSHTLEPIFKKRFGIDHHKASEQIILGESIFGDELKSILNSFGVSEFDIIDVLNGNDEEFSGFFSGPVNFDTIEGILRSRNYLKMQNLGITPLRVVEAAVCRDNPKSENIVDNFWTCKDEMYNLVIRSRVGVLFDSLFQEVAIDLIDELDESDFFITDSQLFRKFSSFRDATKRELWPKMAEALLPDELQFQVRRFYIDESVSFTSRNDGQRYRQSKTLSKLTLQGVLSA